MKKEPKSLVITTVADLIDILGREIADGRNPKSPEDWERIVSLLIQEDKVDVVAPIRGGKKTVDNLKKSMRESGIDFDEL